MSDDPFKPISGPGGAPKPKREAEWASVTPVPADAPGAPRQHPGLGLPTQIWEYRSADGLLGYVMRFDEAGGGKSFRPCCLFRHKAGRLEWRWESWAEPRPLYGLDRLAENGSGSEPIIVCEGEKAADAAAELTGLVAITSPAGSKSAGKANWQPLSGRDVVIWPDADEPGAKYAETVAQLLTLARARSVKVIAPPSGVATGWDAADALDEGWDRDRALELVGAAGYAPGKGAGKKKAEGEEQTARPRQRDGLIACAEAAQYWHSPNMVAFASIPHPEGHHEHYRLDSAAFKRWLAGRHYAESGGVPATQLLNDALRILEVKAIAGPEHTPAMRTAWHDGASWLDLCNDKWRAVKVTADGWSIVADPPVKFIRTETMKALPDPEPGYLIETLRGFVNADEPNFRLIVSWLLGGLWGRATAYPVLAIGGEQGSGKTTMARLLRSIVDPSAVPAMAMPRDERDLVAMAISSHVLSFDNVSRVDNWFSDSVCRVSTGSGFLARKLNTDGDAFFFQGSRPCILNGIPSLTDRADLADRSLTVQLHTIPESERRAEAEWWREVEQALPGILGALLDALSAAVRNIDTVKLKGLPRMADFALLMAAAESALGWAPGDFAQAYDDNRKATADIAFEADSIAMAVETLMQGKESGYMWEGNATLLLSILGTLVTEDVRRSKFWPTKPSALGALLLRSAPLLRRRGIDIVSRHTGNERLKQIIKR